MTARTENIIKYILVTIASLLFLAYEIYQADIQRQQDLEEYEEQMQYQQSLQQ